ncbi:hypothetical protein PAXRUDRAFT_20547 [Paxillus rubicundulus Ve08.2h10]|uniref:Uncharacterized protein n=1 Tax=Paxillus rubicundulus Ve08.2h10 TaxID=930991 RepID=A0A0D0D1G7_9AGAM|nr:hypothetical protein PAXRUDRAFT_20547 [Paxillus rubicundulus Ve08.2h10]
MGRRKRCHEVLISNLATARERKRARVHGTGGQVAVDSGLQARKENEQIPFVSPGPVHSTTNNQTHLHSVSVSGPPVRGFDSEVLSEVQTGIGDETGAPGTDTEIWELTTSYFVLVPTQTQCHEPVEALQVGLGCVPSTHGCVAAGAHADVPPLSCISGASIPGGDGCSGRSISCEEVFDDEEDLVAIQGPQWRDNVTNQSDGP